MVIAMSPDDAQGVSAGESMTIEEALWDLGVRPGTLSDAERARLDRDGFAVFPGLLDPATVAAARSAIAVLEEAEGAWDTNVNPRDPGAARFHTPTPGRAPTPTEAGPASS